MKIPITTTLVFVMSQQLVNYIRVCRARIFKYEVGVIEVIISVGVHILTETVGVQGWGGGSPHINLNPVSLA